MKPLLFLIVILFVAMGCSTSLQPLKTERARPGTLSEAFNEIKKLPEPQSKAVAAVYRFRDQTGQYKPSNQGASWSTAVTQGATSILIESLEESGWFTPLEREGLSNLLNERKIISNTRRQHQDQSPLPPLLFGGIILEGGIIGYDTNVITGGAGARLLGTGGSTQFRKDQVTIYLRAISTKTGRVLTNVHTTKSIISQELQGGVFKYIDTNRLLEAEAGLTYNEPPVMAVTEAIDEAIKQLIIRGENEGLWAPQDSAAFSDYKKQFAQLQDWKRRAEIDYFGTRKSSEWRQRTHLSANVLTGSHIGSYENRQTEPGLAGKAEYFASPGWSIRGNGQISRIGAADVFDKTYYGLDMTLHRYITQSHRLSPHVGIGGGLILYPKALESTGRRYFETANAVAGLDYRLSKNIGLQLDFHYRYLLRDGVDGITKGTIHDQIWNVTAGITFRPVSLVKSLIF